ncbi:Eco57I restriction-modification methylase domain-containing protein [Selenomonas sp.]|uniref:Eco57I restriction-modification methylase domain-containing protein n=1 Tax=Selenomonas sp. TaxID=2053611 RepID=UPI0025D078BC|nr:Eco57I restriction-modification methylase domain-containing protein [Selenomonas sp.]MCI6282983.1 Eco57I restriction-modification methylase domain-containing protein [Selenomonas sp.]
MKNVLNDASQTELAATFRYKLIYILAIPDEHHHGLLKIGDATVRTTRPIDQLAPCCHDLGASARARVKEYTNTAGLRADILYTELAVRTVTDEHGTRLEGFRDHDVHAVLERSGIHATKLAGSTSREWYPVDLATAKTAIAAVKAGGAALDGMADHVAEHMPSAIVFRPEQQDAIDRTLKRYRHGDRMLWNAKMRFGKTLCALAVVRRGKCERSIIVTHRPVVDAGWYEDFQKIFAGTAYHYGSKTKGTPIGQLLTGGTPFVYFASIQDLRGSDAVGGKFDKNTAIFQTAWDLVIIDEAHEGTTTRLGQDVLAHLQKKKLLALSGTPFNIERGFSEDETFRWTYIDEQKAKAGWDRLHFGDANPYADLPSMHILTYRLDRILQNPIYMDISGRSFSFREFFRTWTGDPQKDHVLIPPDAAIGDFVHEDDITRFLGLLTHEDSGSRYPFAGASYRAQFHHTLWVLPGVREARALSKLLRHHPVFGHFAIVNVAGNGDEEEARETALEKVRKAIADAGPDGYTITLTCGKLTTGVTVPAWTAALLLAGSYETAASAYLQTIFRVQSPCSRDGRVKEHCYVFDFAPDRALKMLAESVAVSTRAGKTTSDEERVLLGEVTNYYGVVAIEGSEVRPIDVTRLMQTLKRVYAERAVVDGFDNVHLYNDNLLRLTTGDVKEFERLGKIVEKLTRTAPDKIHVNRQGMTDEQREKAREAAEKRRRGKKLTKEEEALLRRQRELLENKKKAIATLRAISIRMPLLIYGADVPIEEDVTLDYLVQNVDDASWEEFMPTGVTKRLFRKFRKFYDEDVFLAAGKRIRAIVREADKLAPMERTQRIAKLFSYFKNPDKETVLTPWFVVNMQLSDCIGGYDFYDVSHERLLPKPRWVSQGRVTDDIFEVPDAHILEINSKTGLYPLYMTYSRYACKCKKVAAYELTGEKRRFLWRQTLEDDIYVICRTKMAQRITHRTLAGFGDATVNTHHFKTDIVDILRDNPKSFIRRIHQPQFWHKDPATKGNSMQFDAIVGNPPFQLKDNGNRNSAKPLYQYFVTQSKAIAPHYLSMITPSRWFAGGKGLDDYRAAMLSDKRMKKLVDYVDSRDCFASVDIAGGVSYFFWDRGYNGPCEFTSIHGTKRNTLVRNLDDYDIFLRNNDSARLIHEITTSGDRMMSEIVGSRNTFGLATNERGSQEKTRGDMLALACSQKSNQLDFAFVPPEAVKSNSDLVDKYKVVIGRSVPRNGEVGVDPAQGFRAITTVHVFGPRIVFTDTYLLLAAFDDRTEAEHFAHYMTLRFPRFLLHETYSSMSISKDNFRFVPFLDYRKDWTDDELFARYHCTPDEQAMINSLIRPLEYVTHVAEAIADSQ